MEEFLVAWAFAILALLPFLCIILILGSLIAMVGAMWSIAKDRDGIEASRLWKDYDSQRKRRRR